MYCAHVTIEDTSESGDAWERWKRHEGEMMRLAPGWIKRVLLRVQEKPSRHYYITFWETEEQAIAFSNTDAFKQAAASFNLQGVVRADPGIEKCDVVLDEVASPITPDE